MNVLSTFEYFLPFFHVASRHCTGRNGFYLGSFRVIYRCVPTLQPGSCEAAIKALSRAEQREAAVAPEAESGPFWPRAALPGTKGARGRGRWHTHAFLRAAGWGRRLSGTDPSPALSPDRKLSPHRPGQPGLPLPLRVLAGGL